MNFCPLIEGHDIITTTDAIQHQHLIEKDGKRDALAAVVTAKREVRQ